MCTDRVVYNRYMEVMLKRTIRIVSYAITATVVAFMGLLFAQKTSAHYSTLVPSIDTAHADAPIISGDSDAFDGGGGDDDDDDDDDS